MSVFIVLAGRITNTVHSVYTFSSITSVGTASNSCGQVHCGCICPIHCRRVPVFLRNCQECYERKNSGAWETIRAAKGRELCASVEDFLLELCVVHNTQLVEDILLRMATETALDEAIQHYITVTNQRMQDHRNLTFHSPCGESRPMGRHLLQTNGVARDSPGVATADQCTSSCDWSCVNQGACGCDAGYDCRVSSWEVKCRHDDSCACDCCPSCSVTRNPRHPTFIPQPPTRIISAEVVVADACTNTSLKTRSAKPRVLLSTLILYEY